MLALMHVPCEGSMNWGEGLRFDTQHGWSVCGGGGRYSECSSEFSVATWGERGFLG